jgi:hypothetical protein
MAHSICPAAIPLLQTLPHMLIEARVTSIWKKQKLFVAVFLLAMSGWFLFDGKIGYPRSNERYDAWAKFRDDGHLQDWPDYARQRGWVEKPPEHAFTQAQINGQFLYGALGTVAGLITLIYWLAHKGRVLRLDGEAVTTPAGARVPFAAITGLGLKKWDTKGLATVRYEIDGRKGSFVVDDYKFDTQPARQILDEIKARVEALQPAEKAGADATNGANDSPKPGGEGIA